MMEHLYLSHFKYIPIKDQNYGQFQDQSSNMIFSFSPQKLDQKNPNFYFLATVFCKKTQKDHDCSKVPLRLACSKSENYFLHKWLTVGPSYCPLGRLPIQGCSTNNFFGNCSTIFFSEDTKDHENRYTVQQKAQISLQSLVRK